MFTLLKSSYALRQTLSLTTLLLVSAVYFSTNVATLYADPLNEPGFDPLHQDQCQGGISLDPDRCVKVPDGDYGGIAYQPKDIQCQTTECEVCVDSCDGGLDFWWTYCEEQYTLRRRRLCMEKYWERYTECLFGFSGCFQPTYGAAANPNSFSQESAASY